MSKLERMVELKESAAPLVGQTCAEGIRLVWGEGDLDARIMLIGEAPGAQEDRFGKPFVGQAGQLLERELLRAGAPRESVYITNLVKCRPTKLHGGSLSNRTPTAKEAAAWHETLMREIELISPRVIVCLGAVAASSVIHPRFAMNVERGTWFDGPSGTRAIATFHPAYLLRMMGYGGDEAIALFRQDLAAAIEAAGGSAPQ